MSLFPEIVGGLECGADFSPCRTYRYRLWRRWAEGPALNCIGLNPSTADEIVNDPTIERLIYRARQWGYPALIMTNLFALRSTNPKALRFASDPVGPDNNPILKREARLAGMVLCAWGKNGSLMGRGYTVSRMLRAAKVPLFALRVGKDGSPSHPLYLPYSLEPMRWTQSNQA